MNIKFFSKKFIISVIICLFFSVFLFGKNVMGRITENLPVSYISDTFPDSYMPYINQLKAQHPNWIFKAVYTGLDWNETIKHESYEVNESISLVPDSYDAAWKKDGQNIYKDGNFVVASKEAVAYMIDPRNHLTEQEVFQFETLNFSSTAHTKDTIEKVLYGTSMYNRSEYQGVVNGQATMIKMNRTYSDIILENAKKYNVSATHIASRIKQETNGDIIYNASISGTRPGYNNLYNYFNIGATAPNAIENGLKYARSKGWTNPEVAIAGGVEELRNNWIKWGQNSTYFQKWDVNNEGNAIWLYGSQYMQNIIAPTSESIMTHKSYEKMGMLNNTFEFRIPVYNNMPSDAAPYPGSSSGGSVTPEYVEDGTYIEVYDVAPSLLYVRSGPGTNYGIVEKLSEGTWMLRLEKSINTQWDRVRLNSGAVGYVFRDYTRELSYARVTSVSLNKNYLELSKGSSEKLIPTVSPSNALNKAIKSFTSSNPNVATVDINGNVKAISAGETTITVKTEDNIKTATCTVKVFDYIPVTSVTLNKTSMEANVGKTYYLVANVMPENATNKKVIWSTNNDKIATVDSQGAIKTVGRGTVEITAKTEDGGKIATCTLYVDIPVESIKLDKEEYTVVENSTINIKPTILPENAVNKEYDVKIENEEILKYENDLFKGNKKGETKVTFTTKDGQKTVSAIVKVVSKDDVDIYIDGTLNVIDDKYISKIEPETKVVDIRDKFTSKYNIYLYSKDGVILKDEDVISTGSTLKITDNDTVIKEYTFIIYGDINKDSKISSGDYVLVKNHIMNQTPFDEIQQISGDTNKDNKISSSDYVLIKNYIMVNKDYIKQ